jgi:hypothetical protein
MHSPGVSRRLSVMPKGLDPKVKERRVQQMLDHVAE